MVNNNQGNFSTLDQMNIIKESNAHILCFHVWLRAGVGVANPILYLFEKCFNRVLKVDMCSHLVIIIGELGRINETISLFQICEDL
jgi:hypothetical protein